MRKQTRTRREFERVATIIGAVLTILVGVALLVLPGPGLVVIALGLALLSREVPLLRPYVEKAKAWIGQQIDRQKGKPQQQGPRRKRKRAQVTQ